MKRRILYLLLAALMCLASCDMMHEDRSDCPYGVYVKFKYDYNLQRADMFNEHVQAVRLYVFNDAGQYVTQRTVRNTAEEQPLECPCFRIHLDDLPEGRYKFLAVAQTGTGSARGTGPAESAGSTGPAESDPFSFATPEAPATLQDLHLHHDRQPLDTLWHGMELRGIEASNLRPAYDTISLVRDTKHITVSLRELDNPAQMDIADYDLCIVDRNSHLLWDNASEDKDTVVYRPHALWNTSDRETGDDNAATVADASAVGKVGKIGHADFMTSRLIYHEKAQDDGQLIITHKPSGKEVVRVNLPDLLSRLCNYEDSRRYSQQEYLDRGYDYQLDFFLKGDRLQYVAISISVLSWRVVVSFENLGE